MVDISVNEEIRPFFYLENESTFFYTYMVENYNFSNSDSLNMFLSKIDIQDFKKKFTQYYENDKNFNFEFDNLDDTIQLLFQELKLVSEKIALLHQHYMVNKRIFNKFADSEVFLRVQSNNKKVDKYSPIGFISYIKPFGINIIKTATRHYLAVGVDYLKYQETYNRKNLDFLNINIIGKLYSSPSKMKILALLDMYAPLTSVQISNLSHININATYRMVNSLQNILAINCKESCGKLYYSVNQEFFTEAEKITSDFNNRRNNNVEKT
jgi:hypothetical protein